MTWLGISQIFATSLNLFVVVVNVSSFQKNKKTYRKLTDFYNARLTEKLDDFNSHINRLSEEIELLKTHDGLYSVRNDEEQYQMYLSLLRINRGNNGIRICYN